MAVADIDVRDAPGWGSPGLKRATLTLAVTQLVSWGVLFYGFTVVAPDLTDEEIDAEVADTPEKLLFGLAFRDGLPPNSGMLYIFETSDRHRLRTKGFKIPVDMIWVDESRHVVHLVESADPCPQDPCPWYGPPSEKARYVIQTEAGFLKRERLVPGTELKFTLRL